VTLSVASVQSLSRIDSHAQRNWRGGHPSEESDTLLSDTGERGQPIQATTCARAQVAPYEIVHSTPPPAVAAVPICTVEEASGDGVVAYGASGRMASTN